jgi:hypothetical protein
LPLAILATWFACSGAASACPFCGVVGQPLSERRDRSAVVAVGEAEGAAAPDAQGLPAQRFRIAQIVRGELAGSPDHVTGRVAGSVAGTAILFGTAVPADGSGTRLRFEAVAANEAVLAYVVAAPATLVPAAERLHWFARRLEHPERAIAEDAFTEFGLAPFAAVREAAAAFDAGALGAWVAEPGIDPRRRGFYGLAAGIVAARTSEPTESARLVSVLKQAIEAPADDFRAGFDGLMAGILVAEGVRGLDFLEGRGLFAASARPVDQRHLLSTLRFAWESLADTIPRERIAAATAKLLVSPAVAADAAVDLARYRAWDAVDQVAQLWTTAGSDDPLVRRAVAGYLSACPLPEAQTHLERIRRQSPDLLKRALEAASLPAK